MSMGTKLPSEIFNTGYTQPYGSGSAANMSGGFGAGTYDPMLGFGQASGMGTTFNYPTRYSADYTRYAQSGQPFNQPVMGYNSYGQIFAQPQRPPPSFGKGGGGFRPPQPPAMGGKGGGGFQPGYGGFQPGYGRFQPGYGGFQPGYGYQPPQQPPQQPPTMGGKGGSSRVKDESDYVTISYPGGSRTEPRFPQRRSNQLGLNQPPKDTGVPGSFLDFYSRQNNPANPYEAYPIAQVPQTGGPGATPPPLTGGVPTDSVGGFGPGQLPSQERPLNPNDFQPLVQPGQTPPMANLGGTSPGSFFDQMQQRLRIQEFESGLSGRYRGSPIEPAPVAATQGVLAEPNYSGGLGSLMGGMSGPMEVPAASQDVINRKLQALNQGFGRMAFQEGGQVPPDANMEMMMAETAQPEMAGEYDRLIQMTMQAILGQVESPDEIIQMFIDEFGVDAFRQLRDAVLKQQVPGAQTEGMVNGNGGGMDDQVMGMIGNQRPVAVSPGEYIVPADVVSGLGDGSSQAGADILDELNQAVRMTRTGTTQQPRPLMETLQQ